MKSEDFMMEIVSGWRRKFTPDELTMLIEQLKQLVELSQKGQSTMATIKTITIEYGYTFNLGNYSSCRPAVTLAAELVDGENLEQVAIQLQTTARVLVENEIDGTLRQSGRAPHFKQLRESPKDPYDKAF